MYKNLIAEMAKNSISKRKVAKVLNVHENTVKNKLNGKGTFSIEEGFKIRKELFPNTDLQYLFQTEEAYPLPLDAEAAKRKGE